MTWDGLAEEELKQAADDLAHEDHQHRLWHMGKSVETQQIGETTVYEYEGKFYVVTVLSDIVAIGGGGTPLIFLPPEVWKVMKENSCATS